jgi:hypothetical protein
MHNLEKKGNLFVLTTNSCTHEMVLKWFYLLWQNLKWQKKKKKKIQIKSTCYGKVFPIARETSTGKSFSLSFHIYKWTFFVISNFCPNT